MPRYRQALFCCFVGGPWRHSTELVHAFNPAGNLGPAAALGGVLDTHVVGGSGHALPQRAQPLQQ